MGTHQHHHHDSEPLAELLDLDAEVLHQYMSELLAWVGELAAAHPVRSILDIGAGTGTGTVALATRFPDATVTAIDMSADMLAHLRHKAHFLGIAGRVSTVEADLDTAWPDLDPADLIWAASSLHHVADPHRVLTDLRALLHPHGLLVVAELDSFPRFLTGAAGDLEARCHAVLAEARAHDLPHLGADWGAHLTKAGFTVAEHRTFPVELTAPLPPATGRYAEASLRRLRHGVKDRLPAPDLAALDALIEAVPHRDDLTVRTARTVWIGRP